MLTSTAKNAIRAAAALVLGVTGITVFGLGSPASAALPVCSSFSKTYFYNDDGLRVNYRAPTYEPCNLKQGNTGDGVKVLQYLLACNGYAQLPNGQMVQRDGNFGPITKQAVELMQADLHTSVDGEYGPKSADAVLTHGKYPVFENDAWWFSDCY